MLATCIMPTANRRAHVPAAIACFLRQDYQPRELLIVDDGATSVADLVPHDPRIRYVRIEPGLTLGGKRNHACILAHGDIILHWDDDDWYPTDRVSRQVAVLVTTPADVCGSSRVYYHDAARNLAWEYRYSGRGRAWVGGNTLAYRTTLWARNPFDAVQVGEDARFLWSAVDKRVVDMDDPTICIAGVHDGNISPKRPRAPYWTAIEPQQLLRLMDTTGPPAATRHVAAHVAEPDTNGARSERTIGMMAVARESDLEQIEFVAVNHGHSLPRMRRWEIPFALFHARLSNTAAVLDCTINPAGFHERMARHYPHALYRHCSPIQNGTFVLPVGVPDASFDRVICLNTLEHLVAAQRDALMAELARKLKPGGRLVLTADYYFDSSWQDPAFLRAGVMRADGGETFNGWNRLRVADLVTLCARHGLEPLGDVVEDPHEGDPSLYRQQAPYVHATIGGVFSAAPRAPVERGRRVVLALLAWNTRDITLDSVRAYVREARMLRRLGHEPLLCICDNGSTDGLADALRALEPEIDVPCRFILNRHNRGNSIARNQIIDIMRDADADYLLMMDGDIEVVPFSSFAMLRHMENAGHRLGCIGADSAGQTPQRAFASAVLYSIDGLRLETTNLVAWTQYGMFRRAVFDDGIRFDETSPFDGAGWGFEDNDLAFQMDMKQYVNQRFFGMTYLHRDARSSIRIMREHGIDFRQLYDRRKQFVIDKWHDVPQIDGGPLALIRRVTL